MADTPIIFSGPSIESANHGPPRWLSWAVAGLLIFAAAAKAYLAIHRPGNSTALFAQSAMETALALWLAGGFYDRLARWASIATFLIFAIVSLVKIRAGATSCGCFGPIRTSPITMFWVDLSIVAALIISTGAIQLSRMFALRFLVVSLLFAGATAAVVKAKHSAAPLTPVVAASQPSPDAKPDAVGVNIAPTEWLADVGNVTGGSTVLATFPIKNPTDHPLKISDVFPSCRCTSVPNPPDVIPAQGITSIQVQVGVLDEPGDFESWVELSTDDPKFPTLTLRVDGKVR